MARLTTVSRTARRGRFSQSPRRALSAPRIYARARKLYRPKRVGALEPVAPVPGLNGPESRIYWALQELGIRFSVQTALLGGNILGGARAEFLLFDYGIDIEFNGPFHGTTEGRARDILRNLTVEKAGFRVIPLFDRDLLDLKRRILEIIGSPIGPVL